MPIYLLTHFEKSFLDQKRLVFMIRFYYQQLSIFYSPQRSNTVHLHVGNKFTDTQGFTIMIKSSNMTPLIVKGQITFRNAPNAGPNCMCVCKQDRIH